MVSECVVIPYIGIPYTQRCYTIDYNLWLYTRCYTFIHACPNTQCYTEANNVYNVWITEYTRYTALDNNAFYTVS